MTRMGLCVHVTGDINELDEYQTSERPTRFDEFGTVLAFILLYFGYAYFGHLVGVIGGTYCDFVLNRSQGGQMGGSRANRYKRVVTNEKQQPNEH